MYASWTKHTSEARITVITIIISNISSINISHVLIKCLSWIKFVRGAATRQVITHIRECFGDSNRCTSYRRKPDTHDIRAPANKPHMATFHKAHMRLKSLHHPGWSLGSHHSARPPSWATSFSLPSVSLGVAVTVRPRTTRELACRDTFLI
jgi:hypothetical protein